MKIKILGTRGEIKAKTRQHSKQSGLLIDKKIMLDCGEKEFLKYKPKYILITHLHYDHAFFTRPSFNISSLKTKARIYAPEKYEKLKNIRLLNKKIKIDSYIITPIPTIHSKRVKSNAYLIKKGKQKILYTGDLIWINKKYHRLLKNLDLVVTEGSFSQKGGMVRRDKKTGQIYGHAGIPNLIHLFKKFTKRIVLTHFGTWLYKDIPKARQKIEKLSKQEKVAVEIGYDGMEIRV